MGQTVNRWRNKAGAGNGARALLFHVEHLRRVVPDLIRYMKKVTVLIAHRETCETRERVWQGNGGRGIEARHSFASIPLPRPVSFLERLHVQPKTSYNQTLLVPR